MYKISQCKLAREIGVSQQLIYYYAKIGYFDRDKNGKILWNKKSKNGADILRDKLNSGKIKTPEINDIMIQREKCRDRLREVKMALQREIESYKQIGRERGKK